MIEIIGIFFLAAVSEATWVIWDRSIGERKIAVVAFSAMALMAIGIVTITAAVRDFWYTVPAVLGTGLGAVIGMCLPLEWLSGPKDDVPERHQDPKVPS